MDICEELMKSVVAFSHVRIAVDGHPYVSHIHSFLGSVSLF